MYLYLVNVQRPCCWNSILRTFVPNDLYTQLYKYLGTILLVWSTSKFQYEKLSIYEILERISIRKLCKKNPNKYA